MDHGERHSEDRQINLRLSQEEFAKRIGDTGYYVDESNGE